jgi:hypothetical protein
MKKRTKTKKPAYRPDRANPPVMAGLALMW